jgi:hypothetical protein
MQTRLWVISLVCLALSVWFSVFNWVCFWMDLAIWKGVLKRTRAPSIIPLLGGWFGVAGFLVMPSKQALWLCVLPLFWDYGSLPAITTAVVVHWCRRKGR